MNETEQYEFDRQGYLVLPDMLTPNQVTSLKSAVDELEEHAVARVDDPPRKKSPWGAEYHADPDFGYHVQGERAEGKTIIIEDFWNADAAFDVLVDHARTMEYIRALVMPRATINNSEIRIRYKGNATAHHGGHRHGENQKYRYAVTAGRIDCMMVRMVYFIHDCSADQGAFTVVPGTHKTEFESPHGNDPDSEPGTIPLEVKAGDAILFTEALRHGGRTNRTDQVRKTLHVGYGPYWQMSQNIATMDEPQHATEQTIARWTPAQRDLLRAWSEGGHK
ncbi:MAG: phytanoyl-CoA dioxygenase family protein [Candidatus Latescibacterota bacterium]|nr:phytanoyl-CoA dioxygenase family protein [Candidatus Latescibacterota bacterium]